MLFAYDESKEVVIDPRDTKQVINIFLKGKKDFKKPFVTSIIRDMKSIGYNIHDVGIMNPEAIILQGPALVSRAVYLFVQEKGLPCRTEQTDISQGMFRALSIIIQLNYGRFSKFPQTILVDDIGEGLDFDRSSLLIKLLIDKAMDSYAQLIMTTNDRFIMNSEPLEYWSLVSRSGPEITVFNYANSKKRFDEFKFTGLNNFDFFSTDFIKSYDRKAS